MFAKSSIFILLTASLLFQFGCDAVKSSAPTEEVCNSLQSTDENTAAELREGCQNTAEYLTNAQDEEFSNARYENGFNHCSDEHLEHEKSKEWFRGCVLGTLYICNKEVSDDKICQETYNILMNRPVENTEKESASKVILGILAGPIFGASGCKENFKGYNWDEDYDSYDNSHKKSNSNSNNNNNNYNNDHSFRNDPPSQNNSRNNSTGSPTSKSPSSTKSPGSSGRSSGFGNNNNNSSNTSKPSSKSPGSSGRSSGFGSGNSSKSPSSSGKRKSGF